MSKRAALLFENSNSYRFENVGRSQYKKGDPPKSYNSTNIRSMKCIICESTHHVATVKKVGIWLYIIVHVINLPKCPNKEIR